MTHTEKDTFLTTKILAIIPVRNRRETTQKFLNSLFNLDCPDSVEIEILVIDDGSSDGTAEAIRLKYPTVLIDVADGSLFWSGAIQRGLKKFLAGTYDFAWLLNDDVILKPDCLTHLLAASQHMPGRLYSATVENSEGQIIYGGIKRTRWFRFRKIEEDAYADGIAVSDTLNGNCALLAKEALELFSWPRTGIYIHEGFDMFLGLEAARHGRSPVILRDAVCIGSENPRKFWFYSRDYPLAERLRGILDVKGVPPRMYWDMCRRFAGALAPLYFLKPYLLALVGRKRHNG